MSVVYEVWDTKSGNVVGDYNTLEDALRVARLDPAIEVIKIETTRVIKPTDRTSDDR